MAKAVIVRPAEVKGFECSDVYISKMLLDHTNSESTKTHINMGILKRGGALLPSSKHGEEGEEYNETYIILKGKCLLELGGEVKEIQEGDVIYIPSGIYHGLDNRNGEEDLVLLTVWAGVPPEGVNSAYDLRIKEWGKSFVLNEE